MDEVIGRVVLGRYRVVRRLAKGGMGVIYLARNEGAAGFVRPVIVKRILPDRDNEDLALKMFGREARITSQLRHPNIVSIQDFREEAGAHYMVLDYVHGRHLGMWRKYLRKVGRLFDVELAMHIMISVLDALHYAHTLTAPDGTLLQIVHRDVTPSNILIDVEGQVKLTDFGIARMQTDTTEYKTETPTIKGKFPYLAPELLRSGTPSVATDVYSAGVSLHELIVGRNEFRSKDIASTVTRVLKHELSRIDVVRDDVPRGLADVIERAIAKRPEERFATASEFAFALRDMCSRTREDAAQLLRETVSEDFFDPQMIQIDGNDLRDLDHAWRAESFSDELAPKTMVVAPQNVPAEATVPEVPVLEASRSVEIGFTEPSLTGMTVADVAQISATPQPQLVSRGRGVATWISAGLFAAALSVGLTLVMNNMTRARPLAVVIEKGTVTPAREGALGSFAVGPETSPRMAGAGGGLFDGERVPGTLAGASETKGSGDVGASGGATETSAVTDATGSASSVNRKASSERHRSPPTSAQRLSATFSRRRALVSQCFDEHPSPSDATTQIEVRFRVDVAGDVTSAELLPASLAGTKLADCIVEVAKTTKFGPQKEEVSFRIPLKVRRGG